MRTKKSSSDRGKPAKPSLKGNYHHGDLKAAMVTAALKLIAKHGSRGFALSQAAKLAGVSVGAPYRHFKDKEALLIEIAAQGFVELSERIEAPLKGASNEPNERLVAIGMEYVRFAMDRPSHFQIMFDSAIHRRKHPVLRVPADRAFQLLSEAVREAAPGKDLKTLETIIAALWAMMHGHALFAMDNSFKNMDFQNSGESLVHDSLELLMKSAALHSE